MRVFDKEHNTRMNAAAATLAAAFALRRHVDTIKTHSDTATNTHIMAPEVLPRRL